MPTSTIEPIDTIDLDQPTIQTADTVAEAEPVSDSGVAAVPAPPRAEARIMDPAELVIGHNVRPEDQIDLDAHPKQVASIRALGVRDPILAERGPDGQIVVVDGQVRALIARTLGIREVPVYIQDTDLAITDPERLIDRAITQLNLNDRRGSPPHPARRPRYFPVHRLSRSRWRVGLAGSSPVPRRCPTHLSRRSRASRAALPSLCS